MRTLVSCLCCATVCATLVAACTRGRSPRVTKSPGKPRVALVVMDGFGLRGPAPDNAIREALDSRPDGFLARALLRGQYPNISLGASGECVGLEADQVGNSQAGHNAICAGQPVLQRRRHIDRVIDDGALGDQPALRDAMLDAKGRGVALHVVAYIADASSAGYWEHTIATLTAAHELGVADVQVHAICDGRGERTCPDKLREIREHVRGFGNTAFATVLGRGHCLDRLGYEKTRACAAGLRGDSNEPLRDFDDVLAEIDREPLLHRDLPPTPLAGGKRITSDDVVILQLYRRDVSEGVLRGLRRREPGAPPGAEGPTVVTFGAIDDRERFSDDAHLSEAFDVPQPEALFLERMRAAGVRQLRVAEKKKSAHVTYFCDRQKVDDAPDYRRYHPPSISREAGQRSPCLSTLDAVEHALGSIRQAEVDFVMMNLPNADILGHTGNQAATVAAIQCLDRQLEYFVTRATRAGWHVFVTGDHGNADVMQLPSGEPNVNHSRSPVPFIAVAAEGEPPLKLVPQDDRACVGRSAWTVLDALGLEVGHPLSLLAH